MQSIAFFSEKLSIFAVRCILAEEGKMQIEYNKIAIYNQYSTLNIITLIEY